MFGRFPAKLGPKTPPDGPQLEKRNRTNLKAAPETDSDAMSSFSWSAPKNENLKTGPELGA